MTFSNLSVMPAVNGDTRLHINCHILKVSMVLGVWVKSHFPKFPKSWCRNERVFPKYQCSNWKSKLFTYRFLLRFKRDARGIF